MLSPVSLKAFMFVIGLLPLIIAVGCTHKVERSVEGEMIWSHSKDTMEQHLSHIRTIVQAHPSIINLKICGGDSIVLQMINNPIRIRIDSGAKSHEAILLGGGPEGCMPAMSEKVLLLMDDFGYDRRTILGLVKAMQNMGAFEMTHWSNFQLHDENSMNLTINATYGDYPQVVFSTVYWTREINRPYDFGGHDFDGWLIWVF